MTVSNSSRNSTIIHKDENNNIERETLESDFITAKDIGTDYTFKRKIVWPNVTGFLILHLLALWGFGVLVTGGVSLNTFLLSYGIAFICSQGITVGAHRYYTHRSFKATPLLRAILLLAQTMAGENTMYVWVRDHRLHHRYSDSDADPHNARRGFFFSHIGWLMSKKHPKVIELGRKIDMSDLEADWMVMFQKKYYWYLYFVFSFWLPVWVPIRYLGESWLNSFLVCYAFRYAYVLNATWVVNSLAHLYGTRPYDKKLQPVESWFVSLLSIGEGWHNYHHAYPWDYKAAELWDHLNISARTIHFFEKIGLAYDLKVASSEQVKNRVLLTGDGTHHSLGNDESRARITALGPVHPLNPSYNLAKET